MGRSKCCDATGLKRGPWTPEEDQKLIAYVQEHGHGSWRTLPLKAGLGRCGKSCRLRWTNYLRPDIKRGKFSLQEEQTIIQLHALLGNRWSAIATHLPKRTDNEIKNYWNTHLKKRLDKMGIDPVTHKPKSAALSSAVGGDSKIVANLSHTAQWESARLEAEARLVRSSKLRQHQIGSVSAPAQAQLLGKITSPRAPPRCLDVITARQGGAAGGGFGIGGCSIDSPTSTLTFSENVPPASAVGSSVISMFTDACEGEVCEEGDEEWRGFQRTPVFPEYGARVDLTRHRGDEALNLEASGSNVGDGNLIEGFTNLLFENSSDELKFSGGNVAGGEWEEGVEKYGGGLIEENKNYWNDILDLMNCGSSDSPVF